MTDAHDAADGFLQALDAAPIGTQSILKDQTIKDWIETSLHRALKRLDAAQYHAAKVAHLVEQLNKKATEHASKLKVPKNPKVTVHITSTSSMDEIAFEVDAFLAAARSCLDFAANILARHLGMHPKTSISDILGALKKAKQPAFPFLTTWQPWIDRLKKYRDECVHYRTLRAQAGHEAVYKEGSIAQTSIPVVLREEIGKDEPDTRAMRMFAADADLPVGLDRTESWGGATFPDGTDYMFQHEISYETAPGYIHVEKFCEQHLAQLQQFLVELLAEITLVQNSFWYPPFWTGEAAQEPDAGGLKLRR